MSISVTKSQSRTLASVWKRRFNRLEAEHPQITECASRSDIASSLLLVAKQESTGKGSRVTFSPVLFVHFPLNGEAMATGDFSLGNKKAPELARRPRGLVIKRSEESMNDLSICSNTPLTMSSRDISTLVQVRHADVFRSIGRLIEKGTIKGYAPTAYTHPQNGQQYQEFLLNKRDSYVVVAQLSPEFTAALVDRWQELEEELAPKVPTSLPDALRLAADQAEQIEKQQALIQHQKPAVEFVERYAETRSAKSLREVAKVLGIKEREFINHLLSERIIFRQSGNLLPFSKYQHDGYFTVKTGTSNGHAYNQTHFTPKGINWISKRLGLLQEAS